MTHSAMTVRDQTPSPFLMSLPNQYDQEIPQKQPMLQENNFTPN